MVVFQTKSAVIACLFIGFLMVACSNRKSSFEVIAVDTKIAPMVHTEDVNSLISDSGITRYRVKAKVWNNYSDNVEENYSHFPEKIYVEKFDSLFNVEASILADTAYFYEKRNLWKAIGNVKVKNLQGEEFDTSELYWDQKSGTIYSDKFVRVTRKDGRIFTGIGFHSNQEMTHWVFFNNQGELILNESDSTALASDTATIAATL
ncbi:MAG: LPS export ABC transporter periplasmic protein LptC [Dysgonamonadaceae bacterium]|jgi:LPS export ABC transporter protein LptC|nr:LPS export ABC transporter periplasmic protein LptC [Dysgonamonadaceae bacterium]